MVFGYLFLMFNIKIYIQNTIHEILLNLNHTNVQPINITNKKSIDVIFTIL